MYLCTLVIFSQVSKQLYNYLKKKKKTKPNLWKEACVGATFSYPGCYLAPFLPLLKMRCTVQSAFSPRCGPPFGRWHLSFPLSLLWVHQQGAQQGDALMAPGAWCHQGEVDGWRVLGGWLKSVLIACGGWSTHKLPCLSRVSQSLDTAA